MSRLSLSHASTSDTRTADRRFWEKWLQCGGTIPGRALWGLISLALYTNTSHGCKYHRLTPSSNEQETSDHSDPPSTNTLFSHPVKSLLPQAISSFISQAIFQQQRLEVFRVINHDCTEFGSIPESVNTDMDRINLTACDSKYYKRRIVDPNFFLG